LADCERRMHRTSSSELHCRIAFDVPTRYRCCGKPLISAALSQTLALELARILPDVSMMTFAPESEMVR
jgi:hypothetical protein